MQRRQALTEHQTATATPTRNQRQMPAITEGFGMIPAALVVVCIIVHEQAKAHMSG